MLGVVAKWRFGVVLKVIVLVRPLKGSSFLLLLYHFHHPIWLLNQEVVRRMARGTLFSRL